MVESAVSGPCVVAGGKLEFAYVSEELNVVLGEVAFIPLLLQSLLFGHVTRSQHCE